MNFVNVSACIIALLFSSSLFAASISSKVICADSLELGYGGGNATTRHGGYFTAVEKLNKQLESLTEVSSVSAPSITVNPKDRNEDQTYIVCVTITK
jgi:hypothetical protein